MSSWLALFAEIALVALGLRGFRGLGQEFLELFFGFLGCRGAYLLSSELFKQLP